MSQRNHTLYPRLTRLRIF
uniref:Uncharacterized protein n=1 Tax=Arundo donax TaxID=35708 RepID=A0A0A9BW62_ARUDO